MSRRIIIVFGFFLFTATIFGQKEAAVWYFGEQAGLSFVNGRPEALLDGQIDSLEGCASIASPEGDLLFYTNGETIWNRNHEVMNNGEDIGGNLSSTQAALIVPKPGSTAIYYVFTTDAVQFYQGGGNGGGFNYTVVNMSNGIGSVVDKGISLLPQSSEKVTAVLADNGIDIWVITQHEDIFYSYLVSSAGVNTTPVASVVSYGVSDYNNIRGSLKASPDGTRLANAFTLFEPIFTGKLYLYDFDNSSGVVSNEQLLGDRFGFYGVEFSSDSRRLYSSGKMLNTESVSTLGIIQYNMEATDISASAFELESLQTTFLSDIGGTLQLGIDKKIYFTIPGFQLSVIQKPNILGSGARFERDVISLGGRNTNFGLPPFVPSFFESIFDFEGICFGDITQFEIYPDAPVASVVWNFDDPDSDAANTSISFNPSHRFTASGPYVVSVDVTFSNGRPMKRFIEVVDIRLTPAISEELILIQCDVDGIDDGKTVYNLTQIEDVFDMDEETYDFSYYEKATDAEIGINEIEAVGYANIVAGQIVYMRAFSDPSCLSVFPLRLGTQLASDAGIIDLTVCELDESSANQISLDGVRTLLAAEYPGYELTFYSTKEHALLEELPLTIDNFTLVDISIPELFFRAEQTNDCVIVGGILFDLMGEVVVEDQQVYLCNSEKETVLNAGSSFQTYEWSTGEQTQTITVDAAGVYEVTVSLGPGCSDTGIFTVTETPEITMEVKVRDFQQRNELSIFALSEIADLQYSINGGQSFQSSSRFIDVPPGYVEVVTSDLNGCAIATKRVLVRGTPRFFTPNGDGVNDYWHVDRYREYPDMTVTIFDRFGKVMTRLDSKMKGWDGTFDGKEQKTGAFWYAISYGEKTYTGHFALIRR